MDAGNGETAFVFFDDAVDPFVAVSAHGAAGVGECVAVAHGDERFDNEPFEELPGGVTKHTNLSRNRTRYCPGSDGGPTSMPLVGRERGKLTGRSKGLVGT